MPKSSARSHPSLSIRIDLADDARIGPGKIQLLENIETCGSISAAGRAMDMSYKRAWDLVDESLVALVGSDGHRGTRPAVLDAAYAAVEARVCQRARELGAPHGHGYAEAFDRIQVP